MRVPCRGELPLTRRVPRGVADGASGAAYINDYGSRVPLQFLPSPIFHLPRILFGDRRGTMQRQHHSNVRVHQGSAIFGGHYHRFSRAACHSGLCCFALGSFKMYAAASLRVRSGLPRNGWIIEAAGPWHLETSREAGRISLLCRIVSLRALAAFIATHLDPELVQRHRTEHRYLLPDHPKGHPAGALAALTADH